MKISVFGFEGISFLYLRLVGQAVKTPPSHGGNRGSIPLRAVSINDKYGINTKHCEAKTLVRKQECEKCN